MIKQTVWNGAIKLVEHFKQLAALFLSVSAMTVSIWSFVSIDASNIDAEVTVIGIPGQAIVEVITYKIPPVPATVYYKIDNKEILHHHYDRLPDGKTIQVVPLPLEHHNEIRVDIEIVLGGIRTLFTDNDIKFTEYVVVGG